MYAEFDLEIPPGLDEALAMLSRQASDGGAIPVAGGTNVIVDMRARRIAPRRLVSLCKLEPLRGIRVDGERVRMGGVTTISDMLADPGLAEHAPSLVEQARVFGGQMVRNTATVAGNVCSGSPAADTVPPLLALGAQVELASLAGTRTVTLSDFYHGYKEMELRSDELLTELSWEVPPAGSTNLFYKLARRRGDAITVVGVAVAMTVEDARCEAVRIALGSVAPFPMRAKAAEAVLTGHALTPALIEAAAARAVEEAAPIDDIRASAGYRRHCVGVLTRRLLTRAWERLTRGG